METTKTEKIEKVKIKKNQLFYIGELGNSQLSKPYYKAYGQPSKKDAKKKEECSYGSMYVTDYNTQEEYNSQLQKIELEDFRIM